jgi:hypothetical protein
MMCDAVASLRTQEKYVKAVFDDSLHITMTKLGVSSVYLIFFNL